MCSDLPCPRDQRLGILSLILSTLLLIEIVLIKVPHLTRPHLEVKTWGNKVGLEQPMVLEVAVLYREMVKR